MLAQLDSIDFLLLQVELALFLMLCLVLQLQITRVGFMDPPTLVLPLVYDTANNHTQLADKREPGPAAGLAAANAQLKRFVEMSVFHGECSLFPVVRDLLANLVYPIEPPQVT